MLEETMAEDYPEFMNDVNFQIQETKYITS